MSACGINPPLKLAETVQQVHLNEVPFYAQEAHHCGPASLLTLLEASGVTVPYDTVVERVYVPGLEGSLQAEMQAAARGFGRIAYLLPPEPSAIFAELVSGRPVLVLLNLGLPKKPVWHYAVVVGADPQRNQILLRSGRTKLSRQRAPSWLRRWTWAGGWAMVLLKPGEWPDSPDRGRLLRALADFEDSGDPVAAGRAWESAVAHWPGEPLALLGLANMAYRRGELKEAIAAYRRALALAPEHLPARLNLAISLGESGHACEGLGSLGQPPTKDHPLKETFVEAETRLQDKCLHR